MPRFQVTIYESKVVQTVVDEAAVSTAHEAVTLALTGGGNVTSEKVQNLNATVQLLPNA